MVLLMCIINQGGNTLKSLNIQHIILLISVLTLIATIIVLKIVCFFGRAYYTAEVFSESDKPLQNPYCGFYHIIYSALAFLTATTTKRPSSKVYSQVDKVTNLSPYSGTIPVS